MRFATIRTDQGTTAARLDGEVLVPLAAADVGELLAAGEGRIREREGTPPVPVPEADFAPLVTRPGKVLCVGLNYRSHILETGRELPEYPTLFAKFADTLMGPGDDLVLPPVSERIDWEVELGVVIGQPVYRATPEQAAAAIAGYTVINDVSMRDWQRRTLQWLQGKMFEHTTPVGPYLVTPDEVDNAIDLEVRCVVDSAVMQQSRTSDLLFGRPRSSPTPARRSPCGRAISSLPAPQVAWATPGSRPSTCSRATCCAPGSRAWASASTTASRRRPADAGDLAGAQSERGVPVKSQSHSTRHPLAHQGS